MAGVPFFPGAKQSNASRMCKLPAGVPRDGLASWYWVAWGVVCGGQNVSHMRPVNWPTALLPLLGNASHSCIVCLRRACAHAGIAHSNSTTCPCFGQSSCTRMFQRSGSVSSAVKPWVERCGAAERCGTCREALVPCLELGSAFQPRHGCERPGGCQRGQCASVGLGFMHSGRQCAANKAFLTPLLGDGLANTFLHGMPRICVAVRVIK